MRRELCLSPPYCLRFLLTQTLLGGEKGEPEYGEVEKKITEKTDVVSGERRRQSVEGKEMK